jgi:hypothetical protein
MVAGPPCSQSSECRQAGLTPGFSVSNRREIAATAQRVKATLRRRLFQCFGGETGESVVLHRIADLDGSAAHFAIFDVGLMCNRWIQDHRDLFSAVRTVEEVLQWTPSDAYSRGKSYRGDRCGTARYFPGQPAAPNRGESIARRRGRVYIFTPLPGYRRL